MGQSQNRKRRFEPIPELGTLEHYLGFHMKRTVAVVFQRFSSLASRQRPARGEVAILLLVKNNPGLSQDAVRCATGLDKSTISVAIARLHKRKFIERRRMNDRRVRRLFLTRAGRQFLVRMYPIIDRHEQEIASRLSKAERSELIRLLTKVFDTISSPR